MSCVRITIFSLSVLLFLFQAVSAHQIILRDGRTIESSDVTENKEKVTYKKYGGEISIPRSDVLKIVYTENTKKNTLSLSGTDHRELEKKTDLASRLEEATRPKNPIERANMCSVYIETIAGAGSGFFFSNDGFIITNRHVVRGSAIQKMQFSEQFKDADRKFGEFKRKIDLEQERIDKYEQRIRRKWREYQRYEKSVRTRNDKKQLVDFKRDLLDHEQELKRWKESLAQQKAEYKQELSRYSIGKKEYYQKQEEQAGQYRFTITLADGTKEQAILYKVSDTLDLALLRLEGYKTPYLLPAKRGEAALGEPVFAIGAPLNLANSVTSGVLSSYRKEYVQTNAQIYPGNSGGPLVTEEGKVLGVNTMKMLTEKFEGLGFAIRINLVLQEFDSYLQ